MNNWSEMRPEVIARAKVIAETPIIDVYGEAMLALVAVMDRVDGQRNDAERDLQLACEALSQIGQQTQVLIELLTNRQATPEIAQRVMTMILMTTARYRIKP